MSEFSKTIEEAISADPEALGRLVRKTMSEAQDDLVQSGYHPAEPSTGQTEFEDLADWLNRRSADERVGWLLEQGLSEEDIMHSLMPEDLPEP
ncbi:hypothetical protein [Pseudosulfitobacter pseudonitzschiae]|uniref:hypothetical protein n=1 Tax=Pseudosulfitobacter pseudonitzschiae TaxID=1402135 RepID=UPI003B82C0B8